MRWLITGGSGFLGRHLLRKLESARPPGVEVVAIGRRPPTSGCPETFLSVDLDNPDQVARAVTEVAPSTVFHLAGRTPSAVPEEFYVANVMATIRLLDALRTLRRGCRVVMIGSAAELGPVPTENLPVDETYPCHPFDSYGLSKWLSTAAGLASSPPLEVVVARVFNPIGPGLPGSQALGRFAEQLAGSSTPLRLMVGDLDARRDFVDVRDVADALVALAARGQPGQIYNVGTGRSQRIGDGLDRLIDLSGREVEIEVDLSLGRKNGPVDSRADVRKIADHIGWTAQFSWEQSLFDLWEHALSKSRAGLTDH